MKIIPVESAREVTDKQIMESSAAPQNNDKERINSKKIKVHNKSVAAYAPQIKGSTSQDDIKLGIEFLSKVLDHYEPAKRTDRKWYPMSFSDRTVVIESDNKGTEDKIIMQNFSEWPFVYNYKIKITYLMHSPEFCKYMC